MRQSGNRIIISIFIIAIALVMSIALALVANHKLSYLVATHQMVPGHLVQPGDFKVAKASLSPSLVGYVTSNENVMGYELTSTLSAGELLNVAQLSKPLGRIKLVALAITSSDLPVYVDAGSLVDIYQVVNDSGDGRSTPAILIAAKIYVVGINHKSENVGGSSIATVGIPKDLVEKVLNATRKGRVVLVANHA